MISDLVVTKHANNFVCPTKQELVMTSENQGPSQEFGCILTSFQKAIIRSLNFKVQLKIDKELGNLVLKLRNLIQKQIMLKLQLVYFP